jgi:Xaa-Pro aminopeptidase
MSKNILNLKKLFSKHKINGYLIPSSDEFLNEYTPSHLRRLEYVTGFSGSYGIAIITDKKNFLITDGRYLLQAKDEIPKDFTIVEGITKIEGLELGIIGYDPMLFSEATIKNLKDRKLKLVAIEKNLVDLIWKEKPKESNRAVLLLDKKYTGLSSSEKVKTILKTLDSKADFLLITNPDSICWLLNIRGHDVPFTPVLLSYLLLSKTGKITLFCDPKKVSHIKGIEVAELEGLKIKFKEIIKKKQKVQLDPSKTPSWFVGVGGEQIIKATDPIALPKACKNEVEIKGIISAHIEDGVALTKFLYWLSVNITKGVDEMLASAKLHDFRKARNLFQYPSFETISAFGANAAIIHYKPSTKTNKKITKKGLYLIDSGGQYLNGTTDVTRTLCFGKPTSEQKRNYTLVLKGHIALATAKFPEGTTGSQLDILARQFLWQNGLDYKHGTGHGVGHFLSVHEGPQNISKNPSSVPLKENMIISNEPGFYKAGEYGIRIENLVRVIKSKTKGFLEFQTITMVPIATNLIEKKLLTPTELNWVKEYNNKVIKTLSKKLTVVEKKWVIKL